MIRISVQYLHEALSSKTEGSLDRGFRRKEYGPTFCHVFCYTVDGSEIRRVTTWHILQLVNIGINNLSSSTGAPHQKSNIDTKDNGLEHVPQTWLFWVSMLDLLGVVSRIVVEVFCWNFTFCMGRCPGHFPSWTVAMTLDFRTLAKKHFNINLASLCDLFGMVKRPFELIKWPSIRGWTGHVESPGTVVFLRIC